MGAPCCNGSRKRVRPVETAFFPELATSGGPGEDVVEYYCGQTSQQTAAEAHNHLGRRT